MLIYRKIKIEITTPTIKTALAATTPPTATERLIEDSGDNSIGNLPITKRITINIIFGSFENIRN